MRTHECCDWPPNNVSHTLSPSHQEFRAAGTVAQRLAKTELRYMCVFSCLNTNTVTGKVSPEYPGIYTYVPITRIIDNPFIIP